jgi:hypothetical protein
MYRSLIIELVQIAPFPQLAPLLALPVLALALAFAASPCPPQAPRPVAIPLGSPSLSTSPQQRSLHHPLLIAVDFGTEDMRSLLSVHCNFNPFWSRLSGEEADRFYAAQSATDTGLQTSDWYDRIGEILETGM